MTGSGNEVTEFRLYLLSAFVADFFLPFFYILVPLLAYRLGADALELGLVGGTVYATYFFLPIIMGRFSDRLGTRRLFVVIALAILALVSFVYSIASNPATLIAGRIFEGVSWAMLWPTLMAGISHARRSEAGRSLSLYNLVWSGASVLGPPMASILVFLTSYATTFAVTSIVLAAAVIANLVPGLAKKKESGVATIADSAGDRPSAVQLADNPLPQAPTRTRRRFEVAFYLTAVALSSMAWVTLFTFFPPFSQSIGISILLLGSVGLAATGARFLTYLLISKRPVRNRLLDSKRRTRSLLVLLMFMSASSLLFLIPNHIILLYFLSFAVVGIVDAAVSSIVQVVVIAQAPSTQAGAAAGLFESSTGVASFVGPVIAGAMSGGSLVAPLVFPAIGTAMVLLVFVTLNGLYLQKKS